MQPVLAFFGVSPGESAIVFIAILLLFGAKRMPEIARSLGRAIGEFRRASRDLSAEVMKESLPEQQALSKKNDSTGSECYPEAKATHSAKDSEGIAG